MRSLTLVVAVVSVLVVLPPSTLGAQCADGTPPPCEVRAQQVIARVTPPPSAAERGRTFLILPFRNITRAAEYDWLVEGSPVLLSDALGQWEEVHVVPPERLAPALRRHGLTPGEIMDEDRVRRVAEETGGWTAVTGEVLAAGGQLRVNARAYDVATNQVVVQAASQAGTDDPRAAYEELAGQLLATAGLDVEVPDISGATTSSLDAYKAYLKGLEHVHRGELQQAREWFETAVASDTAFAQAYLKLAETSFTTVEAFRNPQSDGYRYAERAASLAQRLSTRDQEFIQAVTSMVRGQVGQAREGLERLITLDSNDVEALQNLAELETFDPILEVRNGVERPRGSLNEAAKLAKRALALDPSRQFEDYSTLVSVYATAGGLAQGRIVGIRGEQPSLMALALAVAVQPARTFTAVLRDSIELIPAESLNTFDPDSVELWRRNARVAARAWVDQWLAATPNAGIVNLKASEVYSLNGDYDAALAHLSRAESLGVEIEMLQNFPGRRMAVLAQAGRYEDALRLADSLARQNHFAPENVVENPMIQSDAAWAYNLNLLAGRFAGAEDLALEFHRLVLQQNPGIDSLNALAVTLCFLGCRADLTLPGNFPDIRADFQMTVFDSLLTRLDQYPTDGVLGAHSTDVLRGFFRNAPEQDVRRFSRRMSETGVILVERGRSDLGFSLGLAVVNMDTTLDGRLEVLSLFRAVTEAEPDNLRAHYFAGQVGALTGRYNVAHESLERLVVGNEFETAFQLAVAVINLDTTAVGRLRIVAHLQTIIELDSANIGALYQIGKIGALTGRELDLAQASLEEYLQHEPSADEPTHAHAHWRLGMIHEHRGDLDAARAAYAEALRLDPDLEEAQQALERLNQPPMEH